MSGEQRGDGDGVGAKAAERDGIGTAADELQDTLLDSGGSGAEDWAGANQARGENATHGKEGVGIYQAPRLVNDAHKGLDEAGVKVHIDVRDTVSEGMQQPDPDMWATDRHGANDGNDFSTSSRSRPLQPTAVGSASRDSIDSSRSSFAMRDTASIVNRIVSTNRGSFARMLFSGWFGFIVTTVAMMIAIGSAIAADYGEYTESATKSFNAYLIAGGVLSLVATTAVLISYGVMVSWRRHPNPILFYRSISDFILAVRFASLVFHGEWASHRDHENCFVPALITQFAILSAECWFVSLSVDLYESVTNPFTSYTNNMRLYHIFSWGAGGLTAFILGASRQYGVGPTKICWVKDTGDFVDVPLWLLFYVWIAVFYGLSLYILLFVRAHLASGIPSTYKTRRRVLEDSAYSLLCFTVYWSVLLMVYVGFLIIPGSRSDFQQKSGPVQKILALLIASKGLVTSIVWFRTNSFSLFVWHLYTEGFSADISSTTMRTMDVDLSPQVNTALRKELLHYITHGIRQAVREAESLPHDKPQVVLQIERRPRDVHGALTAAAASLSGRGAKNRQTQNRQPTGAGADAVAVAAEEGRRFGAAPTESAKVPQSFEDMDPDSDQFSRSTGIHASLGQITIRFSDQASDPDGRFCLCIPMRTSTHMRFVDYHPLLFRRVREKFHVSNEDYIDALRHTAREKLSEGASGAFMFFTKNNRFIVKSMTPGEKEFLLTIAGPYAEYMLKNPRTLLTRFYGCHSISMYEQEFAFIVMANIFQTTKDVTYRYDIKGSWVNRNAPPLVKGRTARCRLCHEEFIHGEESRCSERVGGHEPDVVLKDNDLTAKAKIKLDRHIRTALVHQIRKDAGLLCDLGIMDFSLLLGVATEEFEVEYDGPAPPAGPLAVGYSNTGVEVDGDQDGRADELAGPLSAASELRHAEMRDPDVVGRSGPGRSRRSVRLAGDQTFLDESAAVSPMHMPQTEQQQPQQLQQHQPPASAAVGAPITQTIDDSVLSSMPALHDAQGAHNRGTSSSSRSSAPRQSVRVQTTQMGNWMTGTVQDGMDEFAIPLRIVVGPGNILVGIVDILQSWDLSKQLERFFKRTVLRQNGSGLSAIRPEPYRQRFLAKVEDIFEPV